MRITYLLIITASNLLTAKIDPFVLAGGALVIPVGSVLVGAVFILRDMIQLRHGRTATYIAIVRATILSMSLSICMGETAHIALASLVAFLAGEIIDTEVFTRTRGTLASRVMLSGVVGGTLDSVAFVVLGLSPLGAGVLSWASIPAAILGQVVAKLLLQLTAAGWLLLRNPERKTST